MGWVDVCYESLGISRPIRPRFPLFNFCLFSSALYGVFLCLQSNPGNRKSIFVCQVFVTYCTFTLVVFYLKVRLHDNLCAKGPNSVSGHTFYHIFFFVMWLSDFRGSTEEPRLLQKALFGLVESLHFLSFFLVYLGGYHTFRQIIYGFIISVVVLAIVFRGFRRWPFEYSLYFCAGLGAVMLYVCFTLPVLPPLITSGSAVLCYPWMAYMIWSDKRQMHL
jgi:hypothetical protein